MNPSLDIAAVVEHLSPGKKLRSASRHYYPGGGGINIARVIHLYGIDVTAVLPAGGAMGDKLAGLLTEKKIAHQIIPIEQETREAFLISVADTGDSYNIVMPGPELTAQEIEQCLIALKNLQPSPRYLVASGSLPAGVDEEFYGRLARFANSRNIRLILDTSGAPIDAALAEGVYLVRCNRHEYRNLAGEDLAKDEAARREQISAIVMRGGMQNLIVTLGNTGALLVTPETQIRARPPAVEVASVTGAGDSFVALLTFKLAQGRSLQEALGYAVAAAAAAVTTEENELCRKEDVERLYQQMLTDETVVQLQDT